MAIHQAGGQLGSLARRPACTDSISGVGGGVVGERIARPASQAQQVRPQRFELWQVHTFDDGSPFSCPEDGQTPQRSSMWLRSPSSRPSLRPSSRPSLWPSSRPLDWAGFYTRPPPPRRPGSSHRRSRPATGPATPSARPDPPLRWPQAPPRPPPPRAAESPAPSRAAGRPARTAPGVPGIGACGPEAVGGTHIALAEQQAQLVRP